jgi:hypothetical protein
MSVRWNIFIFCVQSVQIHCGLFTQSSLESSQLALAPIIGLSE